MAKEKYQYRYSEDCKYGRHLVYKRVLGFLWWRSHKAFCTKYYADKYLNEVK